MGRRNGKFLSTPGRPWGETQKVHTEDEVMLAGDGGEYAVGSQETILMWEDPRSCVVTSVALVMLRRKRKEQA